ncbi:hypothetical protein [uncultured Aquimarina sp.]|uniref:hypothetical protein n=1 Tax=uncultured Aquimarina sp. TaxID=575652 RepID=UPI00262D0433|nr:hypothetical protein [uncultured Aquimarina sp.]
MKTQTDKTQERQKETIQRVRQEHSTGGEATIADNRPAIAVQRKLISVMGGSENPIQKKPKGSSQFQQIAATMGQQYGVDTSSLKATHNSSFPSKLQAEATIQGKNIHFAPGMDTEYNIRHEVAHAIDNTINGTPKGDMVVNGQNVDTTRERVVDRMVTGTNHNVIQNKKVAISQSSKAIQRVGGFNREGNQQMVQNAGTCGIYALANAIAVAYDKRITSDFRIERKTELLRAAGGSSAYITAQGELVNFSDIKALIDKYNQSTDYPVTLEQRLAPENSDNQSWLDAVGERENISKEDLNQEAVGAMIAVDIDVLENYEKQGYPDQNKFTINNSDDSAGAHWVMITKIENDEVTIHDSRKGHQRGDTGDIERDYPLWVISLATRTLKNVSKRKYLKGVYKEIHELYVKGGNRSIPNNASGFAKSSTHEENKDYSTMFGDNDKSNQQKKVKNRLITTSGKAWFFGNSDFGYFPGFKPHDVRLKNLIIRVKRADNQ